MRMSPLTEGRGLKSQPQQRRVWICAVAPPRGGGVGNWGFSNRTPNTGAFVFARSPLPAGGGFNLAASPRRAADDLMSPLTEGRGLKYVHVVGVPVDIPSPLTEGRGLKSATIKPEAKSIASPLTEGRGLKSRFSVWMENWGLSPLTEGRGLKSSRMAKIDPAYSRPSRRGVD